MQGFNRYIPPDYNPKETSTLNAAAGKKHALGKRAKDIDKGILIVRFELPFNIWCGTCNAHIGAGVRYNAQKKKVGSYYSTPIFGFRCKCHLCSGWFELRTDPQNAAYVVHEGARKKDEDWNPEENGGFAVHDTEAPSAAEPPADPFAHIEKTIDQQTWAKTKTSRLTELTEASERLSSDPYLVSAALRRRFREDKKLALEKQGRDDDLRSKFGLGEDVDLGEEDVELAAARWEAGRERKGLPVGEAEGDRVGEASVRAVMSTPVNARRRDVRTPSDLAGLLRKTTKQKYDPFGGAMEELLGSGGRLRVKGKIKDPVALGSLTSGVKEKAKEIPSGPVGGLLAGYGSD